MFRLVRDELDVRIDLPVVPKLGPIPMLHLDDQPGRLRTVLPSLGFVRPAMLFTRETQSLRRNGKLPTRPGIRFYGLKDLDALLSDVAQGALATEVLERMARLPAPRQIAAVFAVPKRLARFDDLKLLSPIDDRFARVHSGRDPSNGDRVIIHSYDLSAAPSALANRSISRAVSSTPFRNCKSHPTYRASSTVGRPSQATPAKCSSSLWRRAARPHSAT